MPCFFFFFANCRGSIREDALGKLIIEFKKAVRYEFAQNMYVTYLVLLNLFCNLIGR